MENLGSKQKDRFAGVRGPISFLVLLALLTFYINEREKQPTLEKRMEMLQETNQKIFLQYESELVKNIFQSLPDAKSVILGNVYVDNKKSHFNVVAAVSQDEKDKILALANKMELKDNSSLNLLEVSGDILESGGISNIKKEPYTGPKTLQKVVGDPMEQEAGFFAWIGTTLFKAITYSLPVTNDMFKAQSSVVYMYDKVTLLLSPRVVYGTDLAATQFTCELKK